MSCSVHTLLDRLVSVLEKDEPSSFVPSTLTVTVLKSKLGWPSTMTSTTNVPVFVLGGGGGGGGGGSTCGGGGGVNSRRVKAYSKRSGLPARSRTPISSMRTLSTLVAVETSAVKGTGVAA